MHGEMLERLIFSDGLKNADFDDADTQIFGSYYSFGSRVNLYIHT